MYKLINHILKLIIMILEYLKKFNGNKWDVYHYSIIIYY